MYDVDTSWIQPNTLFLGFGVPVGYLAAFVPSELHARFAGLFFIQYLGETPLAEQGKKMIREHRGPLIVLLRPEIAAQEESKHMSKFNVSLPTLLDFGLSPQVKNCTRISTNMMAPDGVPLLGCEAELRDRDHPSF